MIRAIVRLSILSAVGAWLADRALRGSAPGARPRPFRSLAVIEAPIDRVWDALVDIEAQPRWMREMKTVRLLTAPPVGVGTRGEATVRILGISVTDPVEITGLERPTRFAIRHEGAFSGGGIITLEAGADGTTTIVRWDETLVAPALPFLWATLAAPIMEGIFQADLLRFRDLVEAGELGAPGGSDPTARMSGVVPAAAPGG